MWPSDDTRSSWDEQTDGDGWRRSRPRLSPDKVNGDAVGSEEGWLGEHLESRFSFRLMILTFQIPSLRVGFDRFRLADQKLNLCESETLRWLAHS